MKDFDRFYIRTLNKKDVEIIHRDKFFYRARSSNIFKFILGAIVFVFLSPFMPSRRQLSFLITWELYWDRWFISLIIMALILVSWVVMDYVLPWIDIKKGKKYVGRFHVKEKKIWLGRYLIRIHTPKSKWIRINSHLYYLVQPGDIIRLTKSSLGFLKCYSKVQSKTDDNTKPDVQRPTSPQCPA